MKKIRTIALIASICLALSLAFGCNEKSSDPPVSSKPEYFDYDDFGAVNAEDYRGSVVKYVFSKDPTIGIEGFPIARFEKDLGIKVEPVLIGHSTYVKTIAASIASDTQGDVFYQYGDFPDSLSVMQPLDAAKLNLSSPFWDQSVIKASTLNGHPYLVDAKYNLRSEINVCVYNINLFKVAGLKTPEEYFAEGKWTFENFRYAAQQIEKLGKDYVGAAVHDETVLGAAGRGFFTYKNDRVSVTADETLYERLEFFAQMKQDGLIKLDRQHFGDGRQGMALTNTYGLKRYGFFAAINPEHIGVTHLPAWNEGDKPKITSVYSGWGLIEGAKNPVAAGLFLRYYLDHNNDLDIETHFHNQDVARFFFEAKEASDREMEYCIGVCANKPSLLYSELHLSWNDHSPDELKAYLDSQRPLMNEMCQKANEIIEQEIEQLKEAEEN